MAWLPIAMAAALFLAAPAMAQQSPPGAPGPSAASPGANDVPIPTPDPAPRSAPKKSTPRPAAPSAPAAEAPVPVPRRTVPSTAAPSPSLSPVPEPTATERATPAPRAALPHASAHGAPARSKAAARARRAAAQRRRHRRTVAAERRVERRSAAERRLGAVRARRTAPDAPTAATAERLAVARQSADPTGGRRADADRSRRFALAGGALLVLALASLGLLVVARAGGRPRAWG